MKYQFDRSLLTVDIPGAQPRRKHTFLNQILPDEMRYAELLKLQSSVPKQDPQFGRRRYQHDFHHFCNGCVPQGENFFANTNKKHYVLHEGEIKQYRQLENYYDVAKQCAGDRLLATNDIEGAIPGTLQSQAVRNQERAQKIRLQRQEQRDNFNKALYLSQIDGQNQNSLNLNFIPERQKSQSVYQQQQYSNKYEYMNRPTKLPQLFERDSPVINPITNKIQLRSKDKNYILDDCNNTLNMLQQSQPTRLFV